MVVEHLQALLPGLTLDMKASIVCSSVTAVCFDRVRVHQSSSVQTKRERDHVLGACGLQGHTQLYCALVLGARRGAM